MNESPTKNNIRAARLAAGLSQQQAGEICTLIAYYYQDRKVLDAIEDLRSLDWEIEGYDIIQVHK